MKRILAICAVLLLGLSLGGCSLLKSKTQPGAEEEKAVPKQSQEAGPKGEQGKGESYTFKALKAAIELGIPLKCSYKINNTEYEGFIKGKQWRGKIKTTDGRLGEVIMKDNCMYSWEEGKSPGMKMCFEQDMWDKSQQQATPDVEYYCLPTIVDDGKFVPPANINFIDIDKMNTQGRGE